MSTALPSPLLETLAGITPFDLLDRDRLEALIGSGRLLRVARGAVPIRHEDATEGMWVVLEGEVKRVLLSASGAEKIVHIASEGDSFGEESALLGRPQQLTVQATRDSLLLLIRSAQLQQAMHACPAFALALTTRLSAALYSLIEDLQLCVQRTSTQRVAHYLSSLAPAHAEHCEIRLETDKQTIAAQLNLSPETLSRVLSRFARDGMIRPHGRRGLVLDKLSLLRTCAAG